MKNLPLKKFTYSTWAFVFEPLKALNLQ